MPNRKFIISALVLMGLLGMPRSVSGQALVPHAPRLDPTKLQQQGINLAQEAAQLAQFQQYELALQRAKLATQLAPKSPEVWSLLGGLYLQTTDIDNGITALLKAQSLDGKNSAVLFALGSAYFQKGKYSQAADYLKAGLQIKPNVPGALFDLGNTYLMLGQLSDAIAQYEKAVAQEKNFWPAINNIGLIKYESGNIDEAIQRWQAASAIDDKAAEPRLAKAVALYTKGDRQQGLALAESAIRLDNRYADLKYLKDNLWGDRLLADTKKLLETPQIQAAITQSQGRPSPAQQQSTPRK